MQQQPPSCWLRVRFPPPGFFIGDTRMDVVLDGAPIYVGSFTQGMDVTLPVWPGPHALAVSISGIMTRSKQYMVAAYAGHVCVVTLDYSRFWGNFTATPGIMQYPAGA